MEEISHHTGSIGDKEFSYTELGEGDPLILIPGTLGDEYLFSDIQHALSDTYRVLVFSHLNVEDFDELIMIYHQIFTEELQLTEFHLGGTSVGGWIAQHYTNRYPEPVKSLIIGNSFSDNKILREQSLTLFKITRFVPWFLLKRIFRSNINKSLEGEDPEITEYFVNSLHEMGKTFLRRKLWWSLEERSPIHLDPDLPKLIIYTKDDSVVSKENTEGLIKTYPEAIVATMEEGDHYPYKTRPQIYISHLQSFLDKME